MDVKTYSTFKGLVYKSNTQRTKPSTKLSSKKLKIMAISFVPGIKITAGVSLIMCLIMMGGTSWLFGSQMLDLEKKLNNSGLPEITSSDSHSKYHSNEEKRYIDLMENLRLVWLKNEPILITCSVIAIIAGFFQLTVSLLILFSSSKNIRNRTKPWLITHFMVSLTLIVCILSAFLMRLNKGLDMKSWTEILEGLEDSLKKLKPDTDYGPLFSFLEVGPPLFYKVVGSNLVATIVLFCVGIYFMHKYNDYEPQE